MNTNLLTPNNTTFTTKNLKMMAAVICMTAVFIFGNLSVFAQGISNSQLKTANSSATTEEQRPAKEAWIKEHQEELNRTNAPAAVKPAATQTKAAAVATEKKVEPVKVSTPVQSAGKQIITPESAETIHNAVEVKTPGAEKSNISDVKQTKTMAEERTTRSSSVKQFAEVKPYDKSTVVNDVTTKEVNYPAIPGFVATGNTDADSKSFEVAKSNLQQNNPAEYNKYFSGKE